MFPVVTSHPRTHMLAETTPTFQKHLPASTRLCITSPRCSGKGLGPTQEKGMSSALQEPDVIPQNRLTLQDTIASSAGDMSSSSEIPRLNHFTHVNDPRAATDSSSGPDLESSPGRAKASRRMARRGGSRALASRKSSDSRSSRTPLDSAPTSSDLITVPTSPSFRLRLVTRKNPAGSVRGSQSRVTPPSSDTVDVQATSNTLRTPPHEMVNPLLGANQPDTTMITPPAGIASDTRDETQIGKDTSAPAPRGDAFEDFARSHVPSRFQSSSATTANLSSNPLSASTQAPILDKISPSSASRSTPKHPKRRQLKHLDGHEFVIPKAIFDSIDSYLRKHAIIASAGAKQQVKIRKNPIPSLFLSRSRYGVGTMRLRPTSTMIRGYGLLFRPISRSRLVVSLMDQSIRSCSHKTLKKSSGNKGTSL